MKLLLPSSITLSLDTPDGVHTHVYDTHAPIPAEHADAEAVVVWANPGDRLAAMPAELPRLRWIQALMAGTDKVEEAGFRDDVVLCSGSGLHDAPVAEHTLALLLAAARRLDRAVRAQAESAWHASDDANKPFGATERLSTLTGAHVVIWGFGGIGTRLAGYLTALGAQVTGVATSAGDRNGYPVVTPADLPAVLPTADVLVNILPATPATAKVVDAEVLDLLPDRAWLVNVGRGATVDEDALVAALEAGTVAGAALDVFDTEPLPASSPLWTAPNVIITPHSAGGRPEAPERLISTNLQRLLSGEELLNVVQR
ncbi:NAD(P)-dependent oxidoreductase [Ruania halotolerans]|uniref:NAD(P)-dependent oxidoreductase n=1 Tax=Ruania halotolerans TaxID=2897773 RepID=UPI001E4DFF90|nr:NAD(P)-dependent oxidoreductase [Ruania halotolerans]UFU07283.1 phosphoglycerate dehydrogenase [Ruania halotolerans]